MKYAEKLRIESAGTPKPEPPDSINEADKDTVQSILSSLERLKGYGSVKICLVRNKSRYNENVIYLLQEEGFIIEYLDELEMVDVNIRLKWDMFKSQAPRVYDIMI